MAGRYRLRSVLGSGSMGTVWSAYDEFLHRQVAVKEVRLPPDVAASQADELRERTLREARAIAVLSNPNVIVLHDVVRERGEPYVVMELLPSHSLAELLRDHHRLSVAQAVVVADAVASALDAAHNAGITHRDVKPGNVLVAADGRIKLTDFGIARNVSEVTMTHTGMMLGSPAFIAPEVASGGAVTYAADLWGLGATLFAATEGRPPYDANGDPLETVTSVVHGKVPPPSRGPLAPLIRGLMAKEPSARMSISEVRRRLYPLLPKPGQRVFTEDMFRSGRRGRHELSETREIPQMPIAPPEPPGGGALAADPGPLPFGSQRDTASPPAKPAKAAEPGAEAPTAVTPAAAEGPANTPPPATGTASATPATESVPVTPAPKQVGGKRIAVLAVSLALLFLVCAAGGFALTRVLAGQPLGPPSGGGDRPAAAPATAQELVPQEGDASNLRGAKGGLFSVDVPSDWIRFVHQQPASTLPTSTQVRFVSPDGTKVLGVERFANFAPGLAVDDYLGAVESYWPEGDFTLVRSERLDGKDGVLVNYRTADRADGERVSNRTTVAEAFISGTSLWVVSVTVPVEQESLGRSELFDRIVPTFEMTD
ncbi:Serine/threonine protein kinase [Prauserella marina]|uniref:non-specific serine/threonine protein kinase n=1 Tax=Prauserella marina TaxID=530584 RepID=A0A1G6YU33_9PSEU|nr:serine/threonine protein kinase [Prauserella marina]SDD93157.1 Serine/threonine protein kinase [Prauserella marina]